MSVSVDMMETDERLFTTTAGGMLYFNHRMETWLSSLPEPMSPQMRYEQGLDPKTDHPLHPFPRNSAAFKPKNANMACPLNYKGGNPRQLPSKMPTFIGPDNPSTQWPVVVDWAQRKEEENFVFRGGKAAPEVPAFQGYTSATERGDESQTTPRVVHKEFTKLSKKRVRKVGPENLFSVPRVWNVGASFTTSSGVSCTSAGS